jgi:SSS family solute:Na+ symporter
VHLTTLDWIVIVVSLIAAFLPVPLLAKRAGKNTAEFFTSGRSAPWWLIGVSMVATTFSTDTPNLVTNFVRENGVANNVPAHGDDDGLLLRAVVAAVRRADRPRVL